MSFCNPEVVEMINQGFIPLFAPNFTDAQGSWRRLVSRDVEPFVDALRRSYLSLPRQQFEPFQMVVLRAQAPSPRNQEDKTTALRRLRPDFLTRWFRVQGFHADNLRSFLQQVVRAGGWQGGAPLFTYRSCDTEEAGTDGVHLRVVSRFSKPPTYEELLRFHPDVVNTRSQIKISEAALTAPLREWIPLTRAQAEALLPMTRAAPDTTREIDARLALPILKRMIAPVYYIPPADIWIRTARLWVTSQASDDVHGLARIDGVLNMRYPGLHDTTRMHVGNPGDEDWMEARLEGFVRYDVNTRIVIDLQIVAEGQYCNTMGDRLAYTAAARRAEDAEPSRGDP